MTDKKKTILRVLPLIVLLVGIVLFSGFYAIAAKYLQRPVFPDGAYIDDIAVGGLHAEQAREKVEASFKKRIAAKSIRVQSDGFAHSFTYYDAGAHLAMDDAFTKLNALSNGELLLKLNNRLMAKSGFYTKTEVLFDKER